MKGLLIVGVVCGFFTGSKGSKISESHSVSAQGWNIQAIPNAELSLDMEQETSLRGEEIDMNDKPHPPLGAYPEAKLLGGRDETAICMSGGGTRAYMSTLGYLRGLLDLGVLNRTRYLSSVSGGSWANAAFTFYQPEKVGLSEADFLGAIVGPSECSMSMLKRLDKKSARASPVNKDFFLVVMEKVLLGKLSPNELYTAAVEEVFLRPAGIPKYAQMAWTRELVDDAESRNPGLSALGPFVLPCGGHTPDGKDCDRAFPILNAAILGPKLAAPFDRSKPNYNPIEFNPLYVGSPEHHSLHYTVEGRDGKARLLNFSVGGMVETFAFGGAMVAALPATNSSNPTVLRPPVLGLGPDHYSSVIDNVPLPERPFALANMTAASSFAPGSIISGAPIIKQLGDLMGLDANYWSPVTRRPDEPIFSTGVFLADAASIENTGLIPMLRRRMKEVVVFVHTPTPLPPKTRYDPFKRPPTPNDVDPQFSCFFGIDHEIPTSVEELGKNQVFARYAFPGIVSQMQEAAMRGTGMVVRSELRTVENAHWGVPANHKVAVTWVYLGRAIGFENQLPKAVRKLVQPKKASDAADPSILAKRGPFASFPHFPTSQLHYSAEKANLLANLAGWVVQQNKDLFLKALGEGASVVSPMGFETVDFVDM